MAQTKQPGDAAEIYDGFCFHPYFLVLHITLPLSNKVIKKK